MGHESEQFVEFESTSAAAADGVLRRDGGDKSTFTAVMHLGWKLTNQSGIEEWG